MSVASDNLLVDRDGTPRCRNCGRVPAQPDTGPAAAAGTFDLPLSVGQPPTIAAIGSTYVLRHRACRGCGSLFEVEMLAVDEAAVDRRDP